MEQQNKSSTAPEIIPKKSAQAGQASQLKNSPLLTSSVLQRQVKYSAVVVNF
jgi:hypothetical protein